MDDEGVGSLLSPASCTLYTFSQAPLRISNRNISDHRGMVGAGARTPLELRMVLTLRWWRTQAAKRGRDRPPARQSLTGEQDTLCKIRVLVVEVTRLKDERQVLILELTKKPRILLKHVGQGRAGPQEVHGQESHLCAPIPNACLYVPASLARSIRTASLPIQGTGSCPCHVRGAHLACC